MRDNPDLTRHVPRVVTVRTILIDPQPWPQEGSRGVGGAVVNYVIKAQYGFRQDDGLIHAGDGQIRLAALSPANGNLPSLLGWDVLRRFRLTTDWDTCEVLLEPK